MFLHLSVSHSVHVGGGGLCGGGVCGRGGMCGMGWWCMHGRGVLWQGGMCGRGVCMAGGYAWQEEGVGSRGLCGRRGCVCEGVHARGRCVWQGVCVAGGVCGRGCVWQGVCVAVGGGACMVDTTRYGQWAGGTHPTGMHSCLSCRLLSSLLPKESLFNAKQ